jgi:hypothetical protein
MLSASAHCKYKGVSVTRKAQVKDPPDVKVMFRPRGISVSVMKMLPLLVGFLVVEFACMKLDIFLYMICTECISVNRTVYL